MIVKRRALAMQRGAQTSMTRALRAAARIIVCASLGALAACSSAPSRFYTLGTGATSATSTHAPGPVKVSLLIEVASVNVPAQVARDQIVVQTSASQVDVLEQERWASPPGDEIRSALSGDLTRRLDTIDVSGTPYPAGVPVYRISVNVQRFESWPASQAVLDAVWSVRAVSTGTVLTCHTLAAEPVGPGFDALVDGHRRAIDQMSAQIAAGVLALAAARAPHETPGSAAADTAKPQTGSTICPGAMPSSPSAARATGQSTN
jgi:uncharacterized lipoprotein YmbA